MVRHLSLLKQDGVGQVRLGGHLSQLQGTEEISLSGYLGGHFDLSQTGGQMMEMVLRNIFQDA